MYIQILIFTLISLTSYYAARNWPQYKSTLCNLSDWINIISFHFISFHFIHVKGWNCKKGLKLSSFSRPNQKVKNFEYNKIKKLKIDPRLYFEICSLGSSWVKCLAHNQAVLGSNPGWEHLSVLLVTSETSIKGAIAASHSEPHMYGFNIPYHWNGSELDLGIIWILDRSTNSATQLLPITLYKCSGDAGQFSTFCKVPLHFNLYRIPGSRY